MAGVRRVLLIRHGATSAVRAAAFADGESLEPAACDRARELARSLPSAVSAVTGPEPACRQTAEYLGLHDDVAPELAACDVRRWRGLTLDELQAEDPAGVMAWLRDPEAAPHGGESLADLTRRVAAWMDAAVNGDGSVVAVVDAGVVKAAVCVAVGAPLSAFWRVDIAPLTVTELGANGGRWTVRRLNAALARHEGISYGAPLTSS
jgi:broad specificity phosphatase PhoE